MITAVKKTSKLLLAFMFVFVLSACTRPTGIPQGSGLVLSDEEDENIDLKLKYYHRNCIDVFSEQIKLLHQSYLESINVQAYADDLDVLNGETSGVQPIFDNDDAPSFFELQAPSNCEIAISKAKELNVAQDLDSLAEVYFSTLKNTITYTNQAYRYYDVLMGYKDDDFQEGGRLHPLLMDAYRSFEEANNAFRNEMKEVQITLNLRLLNKFKAGNLEFEYLVQDAWIKGTHLLYLTEAVDDYAEVNFDEFTQSLIEFQKAMEALEAFLIEHPLEANLAEWFMHHAWEFLRQVKEFEDALKAQSLELEPDEEPFYEYEGLVDDLLFEHEWWEDEYPL